MPGKIKVKLTKSFHGRLKKHKSSVRGLGLSRINQVVELEDTPSVRGMIDKVNYMVKIQGE